MSYCVTAFNTCTSQKVVFLIICGKNLTDACIGHFFLTDAFASIASAWIRPWAINGEENVDTNKAKTKSISFQDMVTTSLLKMRMS